MAGHTNRFQNNSLLKYTSDCFVEFGCKRGNLEYSTSVEATVEWLTFCMFSFVRYYLIMMIS